MPEVKRLTNLRVTRVDLVDAGANYDPTTGEGAHIRLFKRAEGESMETTQPAPTEDGQITKVVKAIGRALGWTPEQVAKAEEGLTFDDALFRRKAQRVLSGVSDLFGAWYETVEQVLYGPVDDKAAKVKDATTQLMQAIKSELPGIVDEAIEKVDGTDVTKAGAKISGTRLSRLKTMHRELGKLIRDAEPARAAGGDKVEKQNQTQQPGAAGAGTETVEDVLKGLPEDVRKAIDARFTSLHDQVQKAKADAKAASEVAKAEKDARELAEFTSDLRGMQLPGVDVEKDAPILKKLKDADPDAWKRQLEILKGAASAIAAGALFAERGTATGEAPADSAEAEINKRATEMVTKSGGQLTHAAAVAKIYDEDRALIRRHREER